MSVIIAIKYDNGIMIGADKQCSSGYYKTDTEYKLFKSQYSKTILGSAGRCRIIQCLHKNLDDIMDYKDILDDISLDEKYIVTKVINKFIEILKKNEVIEIINNCCTPIENQFIIISNEKMFKIFGDFYVQEFTKYVTIGCGDEKVMGYLNNELKNDKLPNEKQAEELIKNCIQIACKDDMFIDNKVDILKLERN